MVGFFDNLLSGNFFGTTPPDGRAGFALFDDPRQAAMLGLASGLLQASGRSTQPTSLGQGLGMGLQNAAQLSRVAQAGQLQRAQMERLKAEQAEKERRQTAWLRQLNTLRYGAGQEGSRNMLAPEGAVPSVPGGGLPGGMTPEQFGVLEAMGPEQGAALLAQRAFKSNEPLILKPGDIGIDRTTGKPIPGMVGGQRRQELPWYVREKQDGSYEPAPGALQTLAGKEGWEAWVKAANTPISEPPGGRTVLPAMPGGGPVIPAMRGGGGGGQPAAPIIGAGGGAGGGGGSRVLSTSPFPAPGTQEGKQLAGRGEMFADMEKSWYSDAQMGAGMKYTVGQMRELMKNGLQTGSAAPFRAVAGNVLQDIFGVSPSVVDAWFQTGDARAFESLSNQMVTAMLGGKLGAQISNADVDFMKSQVAQLRDNPQGVNKILDRFDEIADRRLRKFEEGAAWVESGKDPRRFEIEWNKKYGLGLDSDRAKVATESKVEQPKPGGGAQAATPSSASRISIGTTATGPNGEKVVWNGTKWEPVK